MALLIHHTLDVCTNFYMCGKRRPIALLWYELAISGGLRFQVHGGDNHPFSKPCYRKKTW